MKTISCALLALSLIGCGQAVESRGPDMPERHAKQNREAEFQLTSEQFASAFNVAARAYGLSFQIGKIEVKHGAVHDYFQQNFSGGISLTAAVSKETGHITSVTALVAESGGKNDTAADNRQDKRHTVAAISEVVAATVNPRLTQNKASELVRDMMQEASNSTDSGKFPQRFINDVRYVLRNASGIGYWWIANPV